MSKPADQLDKEMRVTFDVDELSAFFDGFAPMEVDALFDSSGGNEDSGSD